MTDNGTPTVNCQKCRTTITRPAKKATLPQTSIKRPKIQTQKDIASFIFILSLPFLSFSFILLGYFLPKRTFPTSEITNHFINPEMMGSLGLPMKKTFLSIPTPRQTP